MTSGIPSVLTSPAFARFRHDVIYLVETSTVKEGRQDRQVPTLTAIPNGGLLIPNEVIGGNTSGLTPAGERGVIDWFFVCHKTVTLKLSSVIQDETGKSYTVQSLRDYEDHYQCVVRES